MCDVLVFVSLLNVTDARDLVGLMDMDAVPRSLYARAVKADLAFQGDARVLGEKRVVVNTCNRRLIARAVIDETIPGVVIRNA